MFRSCHSTTPKNMQRIGLSSILSRCFKKQKKPLQASCCDIDFVWYVLRLYVTNFYFLAAEFTPGVILLHAVLPLHPSLKTYFRLLEFRLHLMCRLSRQCEYHLGSFGLPSVLLWF